jgi:cytochrome c-type biogenesis protein CcmF
VATNPAAVIMFALGAFVLSVVAQEIVRGTGARRAMSGEGPVRAVASLFQRNRRRYGGYTVHVGMSVLFIGVAASTAVQNARDVRMVPGQSATVGGYVVKYVKPTTREVWRGGRLERIALGADLEVRKGGKKVALLHTERGYYPNPAPFATGSLVRGIFEGEATSEVGMKAGVLRDVWTAVQPDPDNLNKVIDGLAARTQGKPAAEQGRAVAGLLDFYRQGAFPSQFRLITSPLVAWIWLGGLIVFAGALIALWPAPDGARGRVRGRLAARVAQDLGRA